MIYFTIVGNHDAIDKNHDGFGAALTIFFHYRNEIDRVYIFSSADKPSFPYKKTAEKVMRIMEQENDDLSVSIIELDIENQSQFINIIDSLFEEGNVQVLLDMTNISYIDSSGLWALFEGHKKAAQNNGNLALLSPTKDVRRVLDITKMSSKMKIYDDEGTAISDMKQA